MQDIRPADAASTISALQYEIRLDDLSPRVSWGSSIPISGVLLTDAPEVLRVLSEKFEIRVGLKVFDGEQKVRELRGPPLEVPSEQGSLPVAISFHTDYLRPGPHRCEIDLVIDGLRWFGKPTRVNVDVDSSESFVDVKDLIRKLSVEELAATAERYFKEHADSEWMYRKPYSVRDIQHNWPQVAVLVRGLNLKPGMSVIDFGAGTGWISRTLRNLGMEVHSLDVSQTALAIGKKILESENSLYPRPPMSFHQFDGRRFPFADQSISRVLCNDALHHIPNIAEVVGEMYRVLAPGGIAGFCEPGERHSLEPRAQEEMKLFTVLENDIDLTEINAIALKAGFRDMFISLFSPYPVDIGFHEWQTLSPTSNAIKAYASNAYSRMKLNTVFFLRK